MKQIAVVLGAINLTNQKKILEGMISAAKETNCNLYVFTNYVGTKETPEHITAVNRILQLPEFHKFDGVVMAANTIHDFPTVEKMVNQIQTYHVPTVSIDREFKGMSCVKISSYDAQFEMVEHFIAHGYRDICYVSGPLHLSKEAQLRMQAYLDAMDKHGLWECKEKIYKGLFTLESGVEAGKKILENGKLPEAIICANDDMAHGIMEVLKNAGYQIPKDVKIAGFDNGELSLLNKPALTTIDKNQFKVGYQSVYEVLALIDGKEPQEYIIPCKLENRESCGCKEKQLTIEELTLEVERLKEKYVLQRHNMLRMSDVVRNMTVDLSKAHIPDEVIDTIKSYVPLLNMEKFYLCLCEEEKIFALPKENFGQNIDILQQKNEDYTPQMELPLAYENGVFKVYQHFEKGLVLPKECRNQNGGNVYVVSQIFYENFCYGYAVSGNAGSLAGSSLYYSWLMEIGVGLEHIRKWRLLKDAVDKLNGMWCYDNMTQLYNRSGFYHEAKTLLQRFQTENKWIFILFLDADGLKTINDTMGHEAGDQMIQALSAVIYLNTSSEMLSMRYGGDEFVIFGGFVKDETTFAEEITKQIQKDFATVNASNIYPFQLSASIGTAEFLAREIEDLSILIEQADKRMYEEKRRKKMRR
ncbi:MAG: GGDEF domain-containing protein [Lachnospiraceae bacterium]|nr:GGDEF domain-containing protein [Lachnospiraceae bacterium]